jgi:hypothetical protein
MLFINYTSCSESPGKVVETTEYHRK